MATLTHEERKERRERIAKYCQTKTVAQACAQFGCGETLVASACREFGTVPRMAVTKSSGRLRIIATLVNTSESYAAVAKRHRVSRQSVQQLAKKCIEAGLLVKPR